MHVLQARREKHFIRQAQNARAWVAELLSVMLKLYTLNISTCVDFLECDLQKSVFVSNLQPPNKFCKTAYGTRCQARRMVARQVWS